MQGRLHAKKVMKWFRQNKSAIQKPMTSKSELRSQVRKLKREQAAATLAAESRKLCEMLLSSVEWQKAGTVLLYHPLPDEVDVRMLIAAGSQSGKCILLPVCVGNDLELRRYEGDDALAVGAFGIQEPTGTVFPIEDYRRIQLALIPGMAFDKAGHRLGRGKGYYDRLLPQLTEARLVGICYSFQMMDAVPVDVHDVSVHDVIA